MLGVGGGERALGRSGRAKGGWDSARSFHCRGPGAEDVRVQGAEAVLSEVGASVYYEPGSWSGGGGAGVWLMAATASSASIDLSLKM